VISACKSFIPTVTHTTMNPGIFYEAIGLCFSSRGNVQGCLEFKTYSMGQMRAKLEMFVRR